MKRVCGLLFELSNEDRLNILFELQKKPLRLSQISEKFGFTVPETSRNIARLTEANLLRRNHDGLFYLTILGEQTLKMLPTFEFLCQNQNYLQSHCLSGLPEEFASGIGVLKNAELMNGVTEAIYNVERVMREADEYLLVLVDQLLATGVQISIDAVSRGVELKKIMSRNAVIPPDILKLASDPVFERGARANKVESRYLDKVEFTLIMSEKELALLAFPNLSGEFDFFGFRSKDGLTLRWCKMLFSYCWDRAKH